MINTMKNIVTQPLSSILTYLVKGILVFVSLSLFFLLFLGMKTYMNHFPFSLSKQEPVLEEALENTITTFIIQKNDTLFNILKKANISNEDAQKIIKIAQAENLTLLKVGKKITFEYSVNLIEKEGEELAEEQKVLHMLSLEIDSIKSFDILKIKNDFFTRVNLVPLKKLITKYEITVDSNVISSLRKAGLSSKNISSLINTYINHIDFQRQIYQDDKITVIAEKFVTLDNKLSHHGDIIYSSIQTRGNNYTIYRYSPTGKKEQNQFFSEEGQSTKSILLKTPIKVVRISSRFGYRNKHPVHGYGAMHGGIDFAAPVGTPIYAAGSGTIEFAGWSSGYGRIVVIKHNRSLSTAYAHASKFANGLVKGSRVKQGDVIAFVGVSGRVTGAHLHYEIRQNGQRINPAKFKAVPNLQLSGNDIIKFKKFKNQILRLAAKLDGDIEIAASDIKEVNLL